MLALIFVGGTADVTAPVLSSPTATATGANSATGTVSTDEGNGTLYYWITTNSSETAANIKLNGSSQSVTATGAQNVSWNTLNAETVYYAHYVQDDSSSNESNVVSSSSITTDAEDTGTEAVPGPGGYSRFWEQYDREYDRRMLERQGRIKKKKKSKKIKDDVIQALALAERAIEEEEGRRKELERITEIAKQYDQSLAAVQPSIELTIKRAAKQKSYSAMEKLERELKMIREEEEFLIEATRIILG